MYKLKTNKEHIVFLSLLATVSPLSTDMYLPAIPIIAKNWHIGTDIVSYSLISWFISFAISLLITGTISDKYGRKPVLLTGLGIFLVASFLCATAMNIRQLIFWRIIQGIGAAAPAAISMAICRDLYHGEKRKRVLAYIGIILAVVPITSPTIGSLLLQFSDWRFIFHVQAFLTLFTTLISFGYIETIGERSTGNIFHIFYRYKNLVLNRGYMVANATMGLIAGPFFGFIAFSPIVYTQIYHLSSLKFGLLFAINASMSMLGAFLCTRFIKRFSDAAILTVSILGCVAAATGILIFGSVHYLLFAAFMSIFTLCCGISRPLSTNLILSQVNSDIGSASGFIVFYTFVVGSTCMAMTTAKWSHPILAFGVITLVLPLIVLMMWPIMLRIIRQQDSETN